MLVPGTYCMCRYLDRFLTRVVFFIPDLGFITTPAFLWKVSVITIVSCLPLYIIKYLKRKFSPPSYSKLSSAILSSLLLTHLLKLFFFVSLQSFFSALFSDPQ